MLIKKGRLEIKFIGLEDWDVNITTTTDGSDEFIIEARRNSPADLKIVAARSNGKFPSILNVSNIEKFFIQTHETSTHKGIKIKVFCGLEDNESFIRYDYQKNIIIQVFGKPSFPERNPLHIDSLSLDDLEIGQIIYRYNTKGPTYNDHPAVILSKPFQHIEKYHNYKKPRAHEWMIEIVTIDRHTGEFIHDEWFLSDMGITPYEKGGDKSWNPQNFTLPYKQR